MTDPKVSRLQAQEDIQESVDGRRLRSEKSREQIIESMFELVRDGDMNPSAARVAEHAGVGLRTVFRHFEDMDGLYREMTARIEEEVFPKVMAPFESSDWRGRLIELVRRRAEIFEQIFPYRVAGNLRRFVSPYLLDNYRRMTLLEHSALKAILPDVVTSDVTLFAALEMTTGFQTWRRLRQDQGLCPEEAEAVMAYTVSKLVAGL